MLLQFLRSFVSIAFIFVAAGSLLADHGTSGVPIDPQVRLVVDDAEEHKDDDHHEDDDEHAEKKKKDKADKKSDRGTKTKDVDGDKEDHEEDDDSDEAKEISIKGRFVSSQMTSVSQRLEEWADMTIKKIAPHGKEVKSGDVLVELDKTDIDKAILDLEHEIATDKLAMEQSTGKLALLKKTTKMDLAAAKLANQVAQEDLQLFRKRDKNFGKERNEFSLKSAKNRLAYQEEELKQLLKMYEADDLTEETEEIVLKRTRDGVESAQFYMRSNQMSYDDYSKFTLPRKEKEIENTAEQAAIALEKAEATLPASVKDMELSIQKQEVSLERAEEKLAVLKRDQKAMTIKAPRAGIVFYGESDNGVFPSPRELAKTLRKNGSLKSDKVFITILNPRPLHVLADVKEADIRHLKEGSTVALTPTAFPDQELQAKVKEISVFPVEDGKFEVKLSCRLGAKSERIVPGMTCELQIAPAPEKMSKGDKK